MIYLDHAATSFPKPLQVVRAVENCLTECAGNAGRGAYKTAMQAAELLYRCRAEAAEFFGVSSPERVIFTSGATASLNLAIKGSLQKGDHVLFSDLEHNAVFRPIYALAREGVITYSVFPTFAADPTANDEMILQGIERLIRPNTKLLVCLHASNICSAVLPVEKIGRLCRLHHIRFVVDAAQSAGHLPVNLSQIGADAVCIPGHKGLLGPQGVGMLLLGEKTRLNPILQGGSGVASLEPEMPTDPPERYEAGTLPLPAIAGMYEGIKLLRQTEMEMRRRNEEMLWRELAEELQTISGVQILAPQFCGSVLSFWSGIMPAEQIAAALDKRGFCVRAGFHCAALAHKTLQTPAGGAVRVSFGANTTGREIALFENALRQIFAEK